MASGEGLKPLKGTIPEDKEWNTTVVLTLAPHRKHKNPDALKQDLGLRDQPVHNVSVNAVIAPFVLNELRVDCSVTGELNPSQFPLQLLNREELQFIQGMHLTPGFDPMV